MAFIGLFADAVSSTDGAKEDEEAAAEKPESQNLEKTSKNIEVIDIELDADYIKWKTRQNEAIPATPIFHGGENTLDCSIGFEFHGFLLADEPQLVPESEDESAEEGEFVPSCWDQSLQPKRSSLKSPERVKSEEVCHHHPDVNS